MSWFGRQMRTYSKNGISANFMYDADGLRSAKGVNGVKTTYQYVGDKLYYEKIGENKTLYYFYDSYGNLSQIYYTFGTGEDASTARYFVATNAQGDVIGLYNSKGLKVGAYDYDAWGNTRMFVVTQDANGKNVHTQINPKTQYLNHIVNVNPIRYRGYYYDSDLDLYYLQSRYYDSEIGRFINADTRISDIGGTLLGYNAFAYCYNNSINLCDKTGYSPYRTDTTKNDDSYISILEIIVIYFGVGVFVLVSSTVDFSDIVIPEIKMPEIDFAKKSKTSGKTRATDIPSWVNKGLIDKGQSAEQNAWRMLNDKYGRGNWNTGPGSEFNKIKKWLTRDCGLKSIAGNDNDIYIMDGHLIIYDNSGNGFGWFDGNYLEFYD